jgi:serine protease Do
MRIRTATLSILAVLLGLVALPGTSLAQPGGQPYVFYSEEPWGGSYLGVDTRDVTPDRVGPLHLKEERGVEVTMVDQDAPAGKAGLKEHDVILSINNQSVESVEQLRRMIREIPAGRTIEIGISRDGQATTLKAQLAERNKSLSANHNFNFIPAIPPINIPQINMPEIDPFTVVVIHSLKRSGLLVENLCPQLGDYFGVKNGGGVLVRSVEKGSRAEQAGFRAGDVVIRVNGSAVNDASDFTRLLRARNENKASVTVMRDRKEQTLTITLPEPKRSGSVGDSGDEALDSETRIEIDKARKMAASMPELMTAEIKRIQPELERANKQLQEEIRSHRGELKKDMEKMRQELREQQKELQIEMKNWKSEAEI